MIKEKNEKIKKSYIVAYTLVFPGYVKTKFEVFTEKNSAIHFYKNLQINILGKKIYESIEEI